jgi:hypothetical protein
MNVTDPAAQEIDSSTPHSSASQSSTRITTLMPLPTCNDAAPPATPRPNPSAPSSGDCPTSSLKPHHRRPTSHHHRTTHDRLTQEQGDPIGDKARRLNRDQLSELGIAIR